MDKKATRADWKLLPEPMSKGWFQFRQHFTPEQAAKLELGVIPQDMKDRWFIFYEDDWLYFCRSWTGAFIFGLHAVRTVEGMESDRCWFNQEPGLFNYKSAEDFRNLLMRIIENLFGVFFREHPQT